MRIAHYGGDVTPEQFVAKAGNRRREKGIHARCKTCGDDVYVHGVESLRSASSFHHLPRPEEATPADDCVLADRTDRFDLLRTDHLNDARGRALRAAFLTGPDLLAAYAFCRSLCGRTGLTMGEFRDLLVRADRQGIWSFVGLEVWMVPMVLLAIEDFARGEPHAFHFLLKKGRAERGTLLTGRRDVKLLKVFSDSGRPVRAGGRVPNPVPVLPTSLLVHGDFAWISDAGRATIVAIGASLAEKGYRPIPYRIIGRSSSFAPTANGSSAQTMSGSNSAIIRASAAVASPMVAPAP